MTGHNCELYVGTRIPAQWHEAKSVMAENMPCDTGGALIFKKIAIFTILLFFFLLGCQEQIDPRADRPSGQGTDPDSPLIGTSWFWNGGWGEVTLYFESGETVFMKHIGEESRHDYFYDKASRSGQAVSLGNFTVTKSYHRMIFSPTWRNYPHDADFMVKN